MRVGEKLKEFRRQKGWSTRKLARELGLSHPMVSNYERGITKIDADFLPKIAAVLGIAPGAFYGEEERYIENEELLRLLQERLGAVPPQQPSRPQRLPETNGRDADAYLDAYRDTSPSPRLDRSRRQP